MIYVEDRLANHIWFINGMMFPDAQMIEIVANEQILYIVQSIVIQVYLIICSHAVIKILAMIELLITA